MNKININCNYINSDTGKKADKRKKEFCKQYESCFKCPCYVDLAMESSIEAMTKTEILRFGHELR